MTTFHTIIPLKFVYISKEDRGGFAYQDFQISSVRNRDLLYIVFDTQKKKLFLMAPVVDNEGIEIPGTNMNIPILAANKGEKVRYVGIKIISVTM